MQIGHSDNDDDWKYDIRILTPYKKFVEKLLKLEEVLLSVAIRFIKGLCNFGLGKLDINTKQFQKVSTYEQ